MDKRDSQIRGRILRAALRQIADRGCMMTIKIMKRLINGRPRLTRAEASSILQLFPGGGARKAR